MVAWLIFLICLCLAQAEVTQDDANAFMSWMENRNAFSPRKFSLSPLSPTDFGFLGHLKPIATDDISEGEVVYKFTSKLSLNAETQLTPESDLSDILSLIHERKRGADSEWAPFIKILPTTFTTPIFWTPKEFSELLGTSIYNPVQRLNATIKEEYEKIIENQNYTRMFPETSQKDENGEDVDEDDIITLVDWMWGYSVHRSRNFKTPNGPKISPVLDLFNYGVESNVKVVVTNGTIVELIAETDIPKGQTLIINDGLIGNRELLDWYGFVVPGNSKDYFPVGVGLDDDEKLYGMKKNFFKQRGIMDGEVFGLKHNLIPRELVFALRIYHVSIYDYSEASNALENKIISSQNEVSMCNTIIDMCEATLDGLTHTLKGDKALLKLPETVGPLRSAIILRRTEKKILFSVLKLAKMQLEDVHRHWNSRSFEIPTVRQ